MTFTGIFLLALITDSAVQLWLNQRHAYCIRAHRANVPAAFAENITLAAHQQAADYTCAKLTFGNLDILLGALMTLLLTLGGGLQWLDQFWRGWAMSELSVGVAFVVSYFLLMSALDMPMSYYRTFNIEQRFGFNRSTRATFFADAGKGAIIMLMISIPLAGAALWLMQHAGTFWWLFVWALWMSFTLLMLWAFPTFIAPLFNRFDPLADAELGKRIEALLVRTGFTSKGIFVMDGSKRSSHGNAYFTGFGRNKRIVFFDTLIKELTHDEIEAVLAHELGHFKHRHVQKRVLLMAAFSLAGLAILGVLRGQAWFYSGLNLGPAAVHTALLAFLLVAPRFLFLLAPITAALSRRHEFEADDYALAQADGRALKNALVKLVRENANTLTPDPLYSAYHDSHPPAPIRIAYLDSKLATR